MEDRFATGSQSAPTRTSLLAWAAFALGLVSLAVAIVAVARPIPEPVDWTGQVDQVGVRLEDLQVDLASLRADVLTDGVDDSELQARLDAMTADIEEALRLAHVVSLDTFGLHGELRDACDRIRELEGGIPRPLDGEC